MRSRRSAVMVAPTLAAALAAALAIGLAGCSVGTASTPQPAGYPLNACPTIGEGAVLPTQGYQLVGLGEIAFAWAELHNETQPGAACGAQSVKGAKTTIHRSDLGTDPQVQFVATLERAVPLAAPDPTAVRIQVFKVDSNGPTLVETAPLQLGEQYRAIGAILVGAPIGRYQVKIASQAGEVLAEGTFEIVE